MSDQRKIRVGILAGGASAERQISLATGLQIAEHLPKERFEVVLLDPLALMAANPALSDEQRAQARALVDRPGHAEALPERDRELPPEFQAQIARASSSLVPATSAFAATGADARIDVAFIALHGPWGEDGTIQGLLDILGIPYVGSGVLASALAMDKAMSKTVLAADGLDVPRGAIVTAADRAGDPERAARDAQAIGYPVVVKPVRQGSSFGISIVARPDQLASAIAEALRYDDRALIEERIEGRELTCGVIGNEELVALPVIEIRTARPFFDYRAKYDPSASEEICPAPIPPEIAHRAQDAATRAHRALGCRGFSRTDLMWTPSPQGASPLIPSSRLLGMPQSGPSTPVGPDRLAVLEVNTIPGMTSSSLLPKAAQVAGIPFAELLERLVRWAMEDRGR